MSQQMTYFEWLKKQFGVRESRGLAESAYFVDWHRARNLNLDMSQVNGDCWGIFLEKVGFDKAAVLYAVDPAIQSIIGRLLDLPILTIGSCSGHTYRDGSVKVASPYLSMIFKKKSYGERFIRAVRVLANERDFEVKITGGHIGCLPDIGGLGPVLTVKESLHYCAPITIAWELKRKELQILMNLWTAVSNAIAQFDGKGLSVINGAAFNAQGSEPDATRLTHIFSKS